MHDVPSLPPPAAQARRLVELGIHDLAGLTEDDLHAAVAELPTDSSDVLLALHPDLVPASALAPLLDLDGRRGFVVVDMGDLDDFAPVDEAPVPSAPLYTVHGIDRGDELANRSPDEALPALVRHDRTPLLLTEGIHWLLHQPQALQRNHCFMTIGSRLRKGGGRLDSRTPAIWISNGTGRDGAGNRNAPKVGWCWAGNRHTWLGFASGTRREACLVSSDVVRVAARD